MRELPNADSALLVGRGFAAAGGAELSVLARGLDEHEWVALDDGDDLGAVADQAGHALQDVAGQRAAGPAGNGDRESLVAVVVAAGAAERPAVAGVEGLLAGAEGQAWVAVVRSMALMVSV